MANNVAGVLVTTESQLVREGIEILTNAYEDVEVIGAAADSKECVERTRRLEQRNYTRTNEKGVPAHA